VAINYAQERMEFIKNNTSLINVEFNIDEPIEGTKYHIAVHVTSDPTDITLNRVTTNVSWQNRDGEVKEVELEMLIYNPDTSGAPVDPDVTRIELSAYPETEYLICCETAVIEAKVYVGTGVNEKLVDYSVMVTFYTTTGTLSYQDAFTFNGIATVNLNNLTSENSHAIVTGMVGALSDTVTVDCTPPVLLLTADPEVIFNGETSSITAVLTDGTGNKMSGKSIEFSITSGDGILNDGTTTASSVTDADGKATVKLSNTSEGEIIIEANYCNVSETTTVTCNALIIEVSASNDYVSPGGTSTITAKLTDGSGNPAVGKTIDFNTVYSEDSWGFDVNDVGVTDENGVATAELSAAQLGTATVKAAYGTLTDTVTVTCTTFFLEVNASDEVIAPVVGTSTITAKLTDGSGNPIEGETIEFSADFSDSENPWTLTIIDVGVTDEYGVATAELSAAQVGTATITGTYGLISDDEVVTCSTLNIVVNAAKDTVVPGKPCTITVTLTDAGNPVINATINFNTTCGALYVMGSTTETTSTDNTNSDGEAQVDLIFSEGDEGKTATITANYIIIAVPLLEISDTTTVTCKMKKDFKVIHGNSVILSGQSTLTLTNGVDYTLEPGVTTEDCFVRIVNTRITGIGRTSGGDDQNLDDYTVQISNPENILTSFNFERVGSPSYSRDCRVTWEIIQYIGAEGGANEIKVRTAVGGLSTTTTANIVNGISLSNILNKNKAVIYITGQSGSNTGRGEWNECLFTAEFIASSSNWIPRFSRGRAEDRGRVSYAVVEFTGSNWRNIQRVTFNSCGSTVPIPIPLLDTTKTFLHCQYRYVTNNDTNSGLDDSGETVEVFSTTQLRSRRTTTTGASSKYHVVWVIENTQSTGNYMIVQHISRTRTDNYGYEEHVWSEEILPPVRALDEASIQGETLASYDSGTAYPIGSEGLVITNTTNLDRIQSDMGQDCYYAHCIVQFPTEN